MVLGRAIGNITRGTTNPNRLRRVDRYIANLPILRSISNPLVVDLGFGSQPITTIELQQRLKKVNPELIMLGIEIDRERVNKAKAFETERLHFNFGGFEIPIPEKIAQEKVSIIRAMNVLRQYEEAEVIPSWSIMQKRLQPNGLIVEGTCDEIGRLASWITLDSNKALSLTLSFRLLGLDSPAKVAERLPKALIHHNVQGEKIHSFLADLENAWQTNAGLAVFSPTQRFIACCYELIARGWQIQNQPKRWRLGELTVAWNEVSAFA
ncbi:MAG: hypothetical protein RIQ88_417 [Actinomycetota bacterium]